MKGCIGKKDGVNRVFKTLEARRLTDFTQALAPGLGVYVNGTLAQVDSDNTDVGAFTLHVAPGNQAQVEASYYFQWFRDTELQQFLLNAAQVLQVGSDPTQVPDGLQPAALHYAAAEAYLKVAVKMTEKLSSTYKAEDASGRPEMTEAEEFRKLAKDCALRADKLRDDYWGKAGKQMSVGFATISGRAKEPVR
jgi:hypothetical protein